MSAASREAFARIIVILKGLPNDADRGRVIRAFANLLDKPDLASDKSHAVGNGVPLPSTKADPEEAT